MTANSDAESENCRNLSKTKKNYCKSKKIKMSESVVAAEADATAGQAVGNNKIQFSKEVKQVIDKVSRQSHLGNIVRYICHDNLS